MTVQELINHLIQYPRDIEVVAVTNDIEEIFLRVAEIDYDEHEDRLIILIHPKEEGYKA